MLTFVLGGVRSGKSGYALALAEAHEGPVVYAMTAEATDAEMARRIGKHRAERPNTWRTVELVDRMDVLDGACPAGTLLVVDCLAVFAGSLVAKAEVSEPLASDEDEERTWSAIEGGLETLARLEGDVVVVSNEVGMGVVPGTTMGRLYRDLVGRANQWTAARADSVVMIVAGIAVPLKPRSHG